MVCYSPCLMLPLHSQGKHLCHRLQCWPRAGCSTATGTSWCVERHHRGALALRGRTGRRGDSSKPARLVHSESRRFLDLSSCESIQDFAPRASKLDQLDGPLENAAVLEVNFTLAEEHESSTMVNDVGTFLLALFQLAKLRETASKFNIVPHVTFVSSEVAFWAKFNERHTPSTFGELNNPKCDMDDR